MLVTENYQSVHYRYEGASNLPGEVQDEDYVYSRVNEKIDPVQVIKAIDCFEYQTCEHPEWKDSEARKFCQALRGKAISLLPGYDEAAWEVH